jgi:hypothetical protein
METTRAGGARLPINGGWSFAFDPKLDPRDAPALWRPEATPAVLTLVPGPIASSDPPLSLDHLAPISSVCLSPDEHHLVADDERGRHRLVCRTHHPSQPLALILPFDADMPIRLEAAARLTRTGGSAVAYSPTPLQRTRLVLLLHILDASGEGLSKRDIARDLIYPNLPDLRGAMWKGSSERRRTHRLVLEALRLRDSGFGDLLHARLHPAG